MSLGRQKHGTGVRKKDTRALCRIVRYWPKTSAEKEARASQLLMGCLQLNHSEGSSDPREPNRTGWGERSF